MTAQGLQSRLEEMCIERGMKMTEQRRVIARVLSEATDHPDVEELFRRSAAVDDIAVLPKVNPPSGTTIPLPDCAVNVLAVN